MKKFTYFLFSLLMSVVGVGSASSANPISWGTDGTYTIPASGFVGTSGVDNVDGHVSYDGTEGGALTWTPAGGVDMSDVKEVQILFGDEAEREKAKALIANLDIANVNGWYSSKLNASISFIEYCYKAKNVSYIKWNFNKGTTGSYDTFQGVKLIKRVKSVPADETDIFSLGWVNETGPCAIDFEKKTGNTIFGTDAASSGDKLSYVSISKANYGSIKVYGEPNDVIRLFINRAENPSDFQVTKQIGTDGVAEFKISDIEAQLPASEYLHLNGVKANSGGEATVYAISLTEKPFELKADEINLTTLPFTNGTSTSTPANFLGTLLNGNSLIYGNDGTGDYYADVTNFQKVRVYADEGAIIRMFVNRVGNEALSGAKEQYITVGAEGYAEMDVKTVMSALSAEYCHISSFKVAASWQKAGAKEPAKVMGITVYGEREKTINSNLYTSFSCPFAVSVPGEVTAVYKARLSDDKKSVVLTEVATNGIPANTGVILYGAGGATVKFISTSETITGDFTGNQLVATSEAGKETAPANAYGLKANDNQFARIEPGITISKDKAYLVPPASLSAKSLNMSIGGGETTAISEMETEETAEAVGAESYNLAGQRVSADYKGIVIKGGKKYMVK
ncbi:MAG: hypothetical protein HUK08_05395 [Bacteroidaceae bacterium]|nr:hypothetical protein [Bacteroidaceae bacterium]